MELEKQKLFEARWYAMKIVDTSTESKVDDLALDQIQVLSELLGEPVPEKYVRSVPDRPNNITYTEPEFVIVKGVQFKQRGKYRTESGMFKGLVVHYTVSGRTESSAKGVLNWLQEMGYGCMVMDENGRIYIPEGFDVLRHWGAHAGTSAWRSDSSLNDKFAGMEICCWGLGSKVGPFNSVTERQGYVVGGKYQTYTEAQEKALVNFILWAKVRNPEFSLDNVAGHDEIRSEAGKRGDKQDPGGSLSMTMPKFRDYLKAQYAKMYEVKKG